MKLGTPFTIAVLISGSGSNLQALLDDQTGYQVGLVLADRADAFGIQRGLRARVPTMCLPLLQPKDQQARSEWERQVAHVIDVFDPQLIVMAGWMRIMSPAFLDRFKSRIINQHPALLPDDASDTVLLSNGGTIPALRGARVVRDALRLRLHTTGCTIHRVTREVDVGPVLARAEVPVLPGDDETALQERIKAEEQRMIVDVVRRMAGEQVRG